MEPPNPGSVTLTDIVQWSLTYGNEPTKHRFGKNDLVWSLGLVDQSGKRFNCATCLSCLLEREPILCSLCKVIHYCSGLCMEKDRASHQSVCEMLVNHE